MLNHGENDWEIGQPHSTNLLPPYFLLIRRGMCTFTIDVGETILTKGPCLASIMMG